MVFAVWIVQVNGFHISVICGFDLFCFDHPSGLEKAVIRKLRLVAQLDIKFFFYGQLDFILPAEQRTSRINRLIGQFISRASGQWKPT